ncbi:MAG: 50S ribosomal protein L18 [Patescibacteria group bacterium]|nr:50S ribosomal protein L18 [Patescibacteria group bacterium]
MKTVHKNILRERRKKRNRARITGSADQPRLSVFRSNRYITAQLIDDTQHKTLFAGSTKEFSKNAKTKTEQSKLLGESLAEKALAKGIKKAVFNKGPYRYHGRVKAVADGARAKGLVL